MMLAGVSATSVKATIDKGLKADRTLPRGNGWFLRTADNTRSAPRDQDFQRTVQNWNRPEALTMTYAVRSEVRNTHDILFYETGLANVPDLDTNTYVPGALADHLTSSGGDLFETGQISALRWFEAGVTASYGTDTEPSLVRIPRNSPRLQCSSKIIFAATPRLRPTRNQSSGRLREFLWEILSQDRLVPRRAS